MPQPLAVTAFVDPLFAENCYLISTSDRSAWIVDPGFAPVAEKVLEHIEGQLLNPLAILLTHCHVDHIAGVEELRDALPGVPLIAPRDEADMLGSPMANLGLPLGFDVAVAPAEQLIVPGDKLTLGSLTWDVLDVAGHSPAGLAYYCASAGIVLSGDSLFADSIGRTDFPGSSLPRLLGNIRKHLLSLPDETRVYTGHGPETTIARERRGNMFLREHPL